MKEIKKREVKRYIELAENILSQNKCMTPAIRRRLTEAGFTKSLLGTGYSSEIKRKEIKVMQIKSRKYLSGTFLVVGETTNTWSVLNPVYSGYAIKILN